jgi:radical SAM superfamily enzyme YgiQ (UPF0313 family)
MAKVVFLQRGWTEQIGIMVLSSFIKEKGHQCELFVEGEEKDLISSALSAKPDLIAFSGVTMMRNWILKIARRIKEKSNIPIIVGGVDPTFFPDLVREDGIDIICRGEGEYPLLELLDSLENGQIRTDIENLWIKKNGKIFQNPLRPLISNLDEFPDPDREIYYKYNYFKKYPVKRIQAGRGCPYKCTYCFNKGYQKLYENKGKYVRFRSVERVIKEIKNIKDKYGFKTIILNDDILLLNRNWVNEFLEKYKREINKPFICSTTVNLLNEEIVKKLKEANCYCVFFGIETGNETLRKEILHKNITNEQILKATELLRKYGIISRPTNMLGIPGESLENAFETLELNIKAKPTISWCSLFLPYPGTELREQALRDGLIEENGKETISYFSHTILKQKNNNKIQNLQKLFSLTVRFPFLKPVVKRIISLPPNFLFDLIFLFSFTYVFAKSHNLSPLEAIYWHARNVKKFL